MLRVITSKPHPEMINVESQNRMANKPFTRQQQILDEIADLPCQVIELSANLRELREELLKLGVEPDYLTFLENAYQSYKDHGSRYDFTSDKDGGLVAYKFCKNSDFRNPKIPYYVQSGIYGDDTYTSIFEHTYQTALISAQNGLEAVRLIKIGEKSIIYCLNIYPGHHATNKSYSGYCFLNNAAICARKLRENYDRIAILDLDYHHGDGTQQIFKDDLRVMTVSIHGETNDDYPFYTGFPEDVGLDCHNRNFVLPKGTSGDKYLETFSRALDLIRKFNPRILIIAFGTDTYAQDPEGGFQLEMQHYQLLGKMIRDNYTGPVIVTQEGGYQIEITGRIVKTFLKAMIIE